MHVCSTEQTINKARGIDIQNESNDIQNMNNDIPKSNSDVNPNLSKIKIETVMN